MKNPQKTALSGLGSEKNAVLDFLKDTSHMDLRQKSDVSADSIVLFLEIVLFHRTPDAKNL